MRTKSFLNKQAIIVYKMWFHTSFFVPPKKFGYNGEEGKTKESSFTISGENKGKESNFTFTGEKKE